MGLSKYKLPNDNVFIWLGSGGIWGESKGIDNILILAGGDVLLLKTVKTIPLNHPKVQEELINLSYKDFIQKYGLLEDMELWKELREGVKTGKYPPFLDKDSISDFRQMISSYIQRISHRGARAIVYLESIMQECQRHISEIKKEKT